MTNDQSAKHIAILLLFVICIGVCGNTLSLIVFSKKNMRKVSIFRFLFYLSVADLLVLLVCSTETLLKFGFHIEIRLYSPFLCSVHTFLTNLLFHFSSIILMVISIERASVICNKKLLSVFRKVKTKKDINNKDYINEKIGLKRINSVESTSAVPSNAETNTTSDSLNTLAKYRFDFRMRLRNLYKYECFNTLLNDKNGNSRLSFISKINRIEMIMIIILIILILINSHYLFFMRLSQNNLIERRPQLNGVLYSNTTKSYKFNNNNFNTLINSNIIKTTNLKLANFSKFFNLQFQDKIKEQIKNNQLNNRKPINLKKGFICYPMNGTTYNYFLSHVWLWIDVWIYSLIPFAVMSSCSIIILIEINRKTKRYLSYLDKERSKSNRIKTDKRLRRNKQLIFMLTLTNLFFILFSLLPYCVSFFKFKGDISEANLGQSFVAILSYINNAFNFLLYGLTSQKYREESTKILLPFEKFKRSPSKTRTNTKMLNGKENKNFDCLQPNQKSKDSFKEDTKLLSTINKSTISASIKSLKLGFQSNQFDFN